jgi:hypothetical protein
VEERTVSVLPASLGLHAYLAFVDRPRLPGLFCDGCGGSDLRRHARYLRKGLAGDGDARCPLPILRVRCRTCRRAPSVVPDFAARRLRAGDAVVEDAVARYVGDERATYRSTAAPHGLGHSTVHRWVTRLAAVAVGTLLALLVQLRPEQNPVDLLPKIVPEAARKGRSPGRRAQLLTALQVLVAGRLLAERLVGGQVARPPTLYVLERGLHMP